VIERYRCFLKTSRSVRNWRSGLFFLSHFVTQFTFSGLQLKKVKQKA